MSSKECVIYYSKFYGYSISEGDVLHQQKYPYSTRHTQTVYWYESKHYISSSLSSYLRTSNSEFVAKVASVDEAKKYVSMERLITEG